MGTTYNGHPSWEHWNVSLWINNDEGLYRTAVFHREHYRRAGDADEALEHAARHFLSYLRDCGVTKTPDGADYTLETVAAAMSEM